MINAYIETISLWIGYLGVAIVVFGSLMTLVKYVLALPKGARDETFAELRHYLMMHLSVGLDFLIAKDVILTLSLENGSYHNLIQLGIVIAVRIVLSYFIHLEEGVLHTLLPMKKKKK